MIAFELFFAVIMPVFALIGIGVLADRSMTIDLATLTRLNFWVFVPALLFLKVLDAQLDGEAMAWISLFAVSHAGAMFVIAFLISLHPRLHGHRVIVRMGGILFNCGNFGIPFVTLAFQGDAAAVGGAALAVMIMAQNLMSYTLGVCMLQSEDSSPRQTLLGLLRIPVFYAIALALLFRGFDLQLLDQVRAPLEYLADGLIPMALITLGVQLSRSNPGQAKLTVGAISVVRLLISPVVAAVLVWGFGFAQPLASILVAVCGLPMAVNVFILCAHYERDEDLASQGVFWTTLLSAVTLPLILIIIGRFM